MMAGQVQGEGRSRRQAKNIWTMMAPLLMASGMPRDSLSHLPCRESTVLQAKLEDLAGLIGKFGLGAAAFSLAAMAGTYSWQKFVVDGLSWDWSFASDYLHFVIIAITILVSLRVVQWYPSNALLVLSDTVCYASC